MWKILMFRQCQSTAGVAVKISLSTISSTPLWWKTRWGYENFEMIWWDYDLGWWPSIQPCDGKPSHLDHQAIGVALLQVTNQMLIGFHLQPTQCSLKILNDIITNWSNFPNSSQARALERSIKLTSDSGEEQVTSIVIKTNIHLRYDNLRHCLHQMVFVIDSVLEPLLTNSIRNASFNQDITAGKLLARCVELTVVILQMLLPTM